MIKLYEGEKLEFMREASILLHKKIHELEDLAFDSFQEKDLALNLLTNTLASTILQRIRKDRYDECIKAIMAQITMFVDVNKVHYE